MTARLFRKHSLFCVLLPKARLAVAVPSVRPEVIVTIGFDTERTEDRSEVTESLCDLRESSVVSVTQMV